MLLRTAWGGGFRSLTRTPPPHARLLRASTRERGGPQRRGRCFSRPGGSVWGPSREPKMAPDRSQEGPWEGHGGVMGGPGALPRGSRAVLGRTLAAKRASWGGSGAVLGPSCGVLGPSWELLGLSWGRLGASWPPPGASWGGPGGVLGASWVVLGASWGVLGGLGAVLGPSWGQLGVAWGRLRGVSGLPEASWGRPRRPKSPSDPTRAVLQKR